MRARDPKMVEQLGEAGLDRRLVCERRSVGDRYSPQVRRLYPDFLGKVKCPPGFAE
jgi:hypothetical protein